MLFTFATRRAILHAGNLGDRVTTTATTSAPRGSSGHAGEAQHARSVAATQEYSTPTDDVAYDTPDGAKEYSTEPSQDQLHGGHGSMFGFEAHGGDDMAPGNSLQLMQEATAQHSQESLAGGLVPRDPAAPGDGTHHTNIWDHECSLAANGVAAGVSPGCLAVNSVVDEVGGATADAAAAAETSFGSSRRGIRRGSRVGSLTLRGFDADETTMEM